ncbi:MAG: tyrosine-type recombinase/integrase [Hyphomicrobium sp.]|nr:tyrosine-type recombinase/integrase [Hyphomicrobium sp.]
MSQRKLSRDAIVHPDPSQTVRTLLDVKLKLQRVTDVPARRIADDISALNTLGNMHKLPGEKTPDLALARMEADPRLITKYFGRKPAALMGMQKGSLNNLTCRVRHAMRKTGAGPRIANRGRPLSPLWSREFSRLPALPFHPGLISFVRYLDTEEIAPHDVTSEHLRAFGDQLEASGMRLRPRQTILAARSAWNSAASRFPEFWPSTLLWFKLRFDNHYSMPWSAFANSFYDEVSQRTAAVLDPAIDDADALDAVCTATAVGNEYDIRRFASALALQTGRDPKTITSISDLVDVDAVVAILQFLLDRARQKQPDTRTTSGLHVAAQLLCSLARNWVKVDEGHLKRLRKIAKGRDPKSASKGQRKRNKREMTKKNRTMLNAFRDERTASRFLNLPEAIFKRVTKRRVLRRTDAAKLACCFAIALLQVAPVRPKNGSGIKLGSNLIEQGSGSSRRVFVHWAPEEVKNGAELHFELTGSTLELFDLYASRVRPRLCGPENIYLFPGRGLGPKNRNWFSTQIAKLLEDEIGVPVTGQQFRHLMGFIYLIEHPGDYETVRQFLGHSDIRTTVDFYAGMQMEDAAKTLDAVVTKRRNELAGLARRSPRSRKA